MKIKAKAAHGFREKVLGLIGKRQPYPLLIKTRLGIHTFGLQFPIDIVVLDKALKVVKLKESSAPNRIFLWSPIYDMVLEVSEKTIARKSIKIGTKIRVV